MKLQKPKNRMDFLVQASEGKRVLHVGCTNSPNTERRLKEGSLLHERIQKVATLVHGIDIDRTDLDFLRAKGFSGLFELDAKDLDKPHPDLLPEYDVVLLGDIIEHVTNPEEVIRAVSTRIGKQGRIVISVPNAFHVYGFFLALLGKSECTHPEHVAFYSSSNLEELARRLGLRISEMRGYYEEAYRESLFKKIFRKTEQAFITLFPGVSCGILCTLSK